MPRFTKADVQFHVDRFTSHAAVNVKVYGTREELTAAWRMLRQGEEIDPRFTADWIAAELTDDRQMGWWDEACAVAWERAQADYDAHAADFWGPATIYSEGRSGGWAVIAPKREPGLVSPPWFTREEVAGWDAIALAKWARFVKWLRQAADDVPYQYLSLIYSNVFEPWAEADQEARAAAQREEGLSL